MTTSALPGPRPQAGHLRGQIEACVAGIAVGDVLIGMRDLFRALRQTRDRSTAEQWRRTACEEIRAHPVREWVHQDPFTAHAFRKPRGYPGDATLFDHIYGTGGTVRWPHPSTIAGKLYFFTTNTASARAVRYQRTLVARLIDDAAAGSKSPRILSIGAGHLREIELSRAAARAPFGRFVAVDQDAASLEVVSADYAALGIEAVNMPVSALVKDDGFGRQFDLVYAAGLFDALEDATAAKLVQAMFESLRPGGTMMYTNFLPNIEDVGYMEALMDWWLACRSEPQLRALAAGLPAEQVRSLTCTKDPDNNIAFVTIHRRS